VAVMCYVIHAVCQWSLFAMIIHAGG